MALQRDKAEGRPQIAPIKVGVHPVRLCRVFDLGVQIGEWEGEKKRANEIYVVFEFVNQFMPSEDGSPNRDLPRVSGTFVKLYKKADKGKEVEYASALDPTGEHGGDWGSMVAARLPALATISHTDKGRDKIASLSGAPEGFDIPPGKVTIQIFDLENPDKAVWDKMPDFIKERVSARVREDLPPIKYARTESEAKSDTLVVAPGPASETVPVLVTVGEEDVPW